tara:strand:- start:3691 stop:4245 length:555 start_codon:yes stop_codon:yes gene_type:complete
MGYEGTPLSSIHQDWETPPKLVEWIENKFNVNFTLDACATHENTKAFSYISESDDALTSHWFSYGGAVWLNPPVGLDGGGEKQRAFVKKAIVEVKAGRAKQVFCLIPARTDTALFHDDIMPNASAIFFIRSRIYYKRGEGHIMCAPFPAMLVVFEQLEKSVPLQSLLTKCFSLTIPIDARRWIE